MSAIRLFYDGDAITYESGGLYYFPGEIIFPALSISGGMQAEGDIELLPMSVSGFFATDGSISIPILGVYGKTQDVADGEILFPGVQIDGELGVSAAIGADVALPMLSIIGDMQADGDISIHILTVSGTAQSEGFANCEVGIPAIGISGSVDVAQWLTGALKLPGLSLSGGVSMALGSISGALALPVVGVSGAATVAESYDFGTETDRTLRYVSARRRI